MPRALELRPDVASVVVGINDTLRRGFDPARVHDALAHVIGSLSAPGAVVLTMRLPDPGRMLGMPTALARPLGGRLRELNQIMDQLAAQLGTLHFDAAEDSQVYDRCMWSVDRLHPSERGHRHIVRRPGAVADDEDVEPAQGTRGLVHGAPGGGRISQVGLDRDRPDRPNRPNRPLPPFATHCRPGCF